MTPTEKTARPQTEIKHRALQLWDDLCREIGMLLDTIQMQNARYMVIDRQCRQLTAAKEEAEMQLDRRIRELENKNDALRLLIPKKRRAKKKVAKRG